MQRQWPRARDLLRRGTGVLRRRARRGKDNPGESGSGRQKNEAAQNALAFALLVKSEFRASGVEDAAARRRAFVTAQWGGASDAAAALARSAAREAGGGGTLGAIVRERQDLVGEWQARDKLRIAAVSKPPGQRNADAEAENAARLAAIDKRLGEIDARLKEEFPDYAALANPEPLEIAQVQKLLGDDEALVQFLDTSAFQPTPEETFVWVATNTDAMWFRSKLGTDALKRRVAALRKALDPTGGGARAARAVGEGSGSFDAALAHELYRKLLAPAARLLAGKSHLLLVPSGALTALPFHVLRTRPAGQRTADGKVPWLLRRHALTTLPSVASLASLRRKTNRTPAPKAYVAFADPVFDRQGRRAAKSVKMATATRGLARFFRGTQGDDASLASLARLADTADEVDAIARLLGTDESDVFFARSRNRKGRSHGATQSLSRCSICNAWPHRRRDQKTLSRRACTGAVPT